MTPYESTTSSKYNFWQKRRQSWNETILGMNEPWRLSEKQKASIGILRNAVEEKFLAKPFASDRATEEQVEDCYALTLRASSSTQPKLFYEEEVARFESYTDQVAKVDREVRSALASVGNLLESYNEVANKTSSLHHACEKLMADQTSLASSAEELRSRLAYFGHVDSFNHKLSSPLLSVTNEAFNQLLNIVDDCIAFLAEHPNYKDGEAFATKYYHCLSRALTLVRTYVRSHLKQAYDAVQEKCDPAHPIGEGDFFTVYYGVFAAQASGLKSVMENIEMRQARHAEYENLLADCHQAYFQQRQSLVLPSVRATLETLKGTHGKNVCALVRSASSFVLRISEDEHTLFYRFFGLPTELMTDFLEKICSTMYDATRAAVIHIPHLEALAELCAILQNEMLDERCADETEACSGFVRVADQLLGDIRERLVYRAHIYARSDIRSYKPASGDLAYPEKLEMMREIAEVQRQPKAPERPPSLDSSTSAEVASIVEKRSISSALSPADIHGLWFPPVRRTIMCLSKLFRCVESGVFQTLSQDILTLCIESLEEAAKTIETKKSSLDGNLFLLKHLLILREQTTPFRVQATQRLALQQQHHAHSPGWATPMLYKETALHFGKIKDAATTLFRHRGRLLSLNNNAVLEFLLEAPRQVAEEHAIESERILDIELRRVCQDFITTTAGSDLCPVALDSFLTQARNIKDAIDGGAKLELSSQGFATPEALRNMGAQAYRQLKDKWSKFVSKLRLYVANSDTEHLLISHIRRRILERFADIRAIIMKHYTDEMRTVINWPSAEQLNVLLSSVPDEETKSQQKGKPNPSPANIDIQPKADPIIANIDIQPKPDPIPANSNIQPTPDPIPANSNIQPKRDQVPANINIPAVAENGVS